MPGHAIQPCMHACMRIKCGQFPEHVLGSQVLEKCFGSTATVDGAAAAAAGAAGGR